MFVFWLGVLLAFLLGFVCFVGSFARVFVFWLDVLLGFLCFVGLFASVFVFCSAFC